MKLISRPFSRFRRNEDGYMVVEAVLVLPLMLWGFLGLYTYWDAYKTLTTVQKASFAISDLLSREQVAIPSNYFDGMRRTMDAMLPSRFDSEIRVSSVWYSGVRNRMEVQWSRVSGSSRARLPTGAIANASIRDQIPNMSPGDTVIVVETWVDYEPVLNIGLPDTTFTQFVVTRPRFAPQLTLQ